MSLTEIIEELPKLSHLERREVCRRVIELEAAEEQDVSLCDHTTREGFAILEKMEAEDKARARRAQR